MPDTTQPPFGPTVGELDRRTVDAVQPTVLAPFLVAEHGGQGRATDTVQPAVQPVRNFTSSGGDGDTANAGVHGDDGRSAHGRRVFRTGGVEQNMVTGPRSTMTTSGRSGGSLRLR